MLAKQSCIPRTTSSRSLLIPGDNLDGESLTFCDSVEVIEKGTGPALCSPCKIVIGFDVGPEKKPLEVCDSPRSVLDSSAVLSAQAKQKIAARSPRSGLGNLLAAKSSSDENVGPGVRSSAGGGNEPSVFVAEEAEGNNQCSIRNSGWPLILSPSKVTSWPEKVAVFDPMDGNISGCQGQGVHVNLQADMEDEILDVDISPIRVGTLMDLSEEMKLATKLTPAAVALNHTAGNGVNCDVVAADAFAEQETLHASVNKNAGISATVHVAAAYNEELNQTPGQTQPIPHLHGWQGGCNEGYAIPCQKQCWQCITLDFEEGGVQQSIFAASSPPPCPRSIVRTSSGFLKTCNFCGCSLLLGKEIFMYRGDQPFCSAECRYQKILIDERKDKRGS